MAGILSIIYLILGYWACGEVLFANSDKSHVLIKLILGIAIGWILIPVAIIKIKTNGGNSNNINQVFQENSANTFGGEDSSPNVRKFIKEIEEDPEAIIGYLTIILNHQGMEHVEEYGDPAAARVISTEYLNSYYLEAPHEFNEEYLDKLVVLKDKISDISPLGGNVMGMTFGDLKKYSSQYGINHIQKAQCYVDGVYYNDVKKARVGQTIYVIGQISREVFEAKNEFTMLQCIPVCIDNIVCYQAKVKCINLLKQLQM